MIHLHSNTVCTNLHSLRSISAAEALYTEVLQLNDNIFRTIRSVFQKVFGSISGKAELQADNMIRTYNMLAKHICHELVAEDNICSNPDTDIPVLRQEFIEKEILCCTDTKNQSHDEVFRLAAFWFLIYSRSILKPILLTTALRGICLSRLSPAIPLRRILNWLKRLIWHIHRCSSIRLRCSKRLLRVNSCLRSRSVKLSILWILVIHFDSFPGHALSEIVVR